MPTLKTRVNLAVPKDVHRAIKILARREDVPVATKALDLIKRALEIDEDIALEKIVKERLKKRVKFISHDRVWK